MSVDRWTGKLLDRPSDNLAAGNGQTCEHCGTECVDRCPSCGAPQCCPNCCAEANMLHCPFCASADVCVEQDFDSGDFYAACADCGGQGPWAHDSAQAAREWNERPLERAVDRRKLTHEDGRETG